MIDETTKNAIYPKLAAAIYASDRIAARKVLDEYPEFLKDLITGGDFLRDAVRLNDVQMAELLVEFGADVNAPNDLDDSPEGPIDVAACDGATDAVRWLIGRGAKVNHEVDGTTRCFPLSGAARNGHFECVKVLVENGAAINACWAGMNALHFAIAYGHKEVEQYLRSIGALEPWEIPGVEPPQFYEESLEAHLERHLGNPEPRQLQEIVPGEPPVSIIVVPMGDRIALVTNGMSTVAESEDEEMLEEQTAELVMYLPEKWPLTKKALYDPKYSWPIDWLRRIARCPRVDQAWIGELSTIFLNGEPPAPLAPNTKLSCLLLLREPGDFGQVRMNDGRTIFMYSLYPIYSEERDLESAMGTERLLELFQKHRVSKVVDLNRTNVARLQ